MQVAEIMELIYDKFENVCLLEDLDKIEDFIRHFSSVIDINYDDGKFNEIIIQRNDIELLKLFVKYGADIHLNNDFLLRIASYNGYIEIIDYLLTNCGANYKVLYGNTTYFNNETSKEFVDKFVQNINTPI